MHKILEKSFLVLFLFNFHILSDVIYNSDFFITFLKRFHQLNLYFTSFSLKNMQIDKNQLEQQSIPLNCSVFIWGMFYDKEHKIFLPTKVKQLQNKDIVDVKSGGFFFLAKSRDGKLYGWGTTKYSKYGYSGDDTQIPRLIPFFNKVKLIAAGNWHSLLVDINRDLYSVGHNKYGSCGNGTFDNLTEFTKSQLKQKVIKISAGDGVSLMITQNQQLYTCGHRQRHGHKSQEHISKPTKLKFDQRIKVIAAGFTHCLAADQKGKLYSWGDGKVFQLGHGNKDDQKQPKLIKALQNIFIIDISCTRGQKYSHSMALDNSGNMYTWGAGYKGKLGHYQQWDHSDPADQPLPKKVNLPYKVKKCCGGGIHSAIVNQQKQALSFGCGSDGRIGHQQSKDHRYLYRQGKPRKIEAFNDWNVQVLQCSYYHNICLASKKK